MIRRLVELHGALQRWLSSRPRRAFGEVLDAAIDEFGTTQIRLRAYELHGGIDDSVSRVAGHHEREEKRG